jgi:hypothetical protein
LKPTLCIDVDSTIWDTGSWVCSAVLEVTGETLDMGSITTWTHVLDTFGEEATTAIFDRVFDPARIPDREPYSGASEVLCAWQESPSIEIHFVTHNDPEIMPPHLEPWLKAHFGPGIGLTVTTGDKLIILEELGAFGLIDDRPDTIGRPPTLACGRRPGYSPGTATSSPEETTYTASQTGAKFRTSCRLSTGLASSTGDLHRHRPTTNES